MVTKKEKSDDKEKEKKLEVSEKEEKKENVENKNIENKEEKKEEDKSEKTNQKNDKNVKYLIIAISAIIIIGIISYISEQLGLFGLGNIKIGVAPLPNVTNTINYYTNNNTNIIMYEFSDFDCPYCDIWALETFPVINQTYISKGLINFVYEYFPLYNIHPYANITALYGSCIAQYYGEQGLEKWYDFIFGLSYSNNITQDFTFWENWNQLGSQSAVEQFINNNLPELGFNETLIENCVNNLQTYNEIYSLENYFFIEYGYEIAGQKTFGTPTFIIAVNNSIVTQQEIQNVVSILKSLGLQYQLYYTPDNQYLMIEFAGALPPQIFEEILNAIGANKY